MPNLRIAMCQINTVVGDLDGNVRRIFDALDVAEAAGAQLAVFPEMTITGYPPEDLVLKPGFIRDSQAALDRVAARTGAENGAGTGNCAVVVGFADGPDVRNAVAVCARGQVHGTYHKRHLPNYQVFDEMRYFRPGDDPHTLYDVGGVRIGLSICEDAWVAGGPLPQLGAGGAHLVLNINGSPFRSGKMHTRAQVLAERVAEGSAPIAYVNLVGGQDELVFDGGSMIVDHEGQVVVRAEQFAEQTVVADVFVPDVVPEAPLYPVVAVTPDSRPGPADAPATVAPLLDRLPELYEALVVATRDYVHKNGFTDVTLGLSGGIDSSLVCAIGADALGPEHVHGVLMPSRFSSDHSITDAQALADALGIDQRIIEIEPGHAAFLDMLKPSFGDLEPDVTEENIQSRVRGVLLMALANKFGWLVLTTGNKSEAAVGYSTLYGDTAGAYACIKDVYKLTVYELSRYVNERHGREIIPARVITKPPSAELRPDQRDDQSLPPYEQLDPLLEAYIEGDATRAELIEQGFEPDMVQRICRLVDISEFKRRQTPLGARVTTKAFGRDRRLPITNGYRG
ncbi:MAG: NAD+ synthase [Acidimicrobiales bacterium]|nr:NAD+ synthase [Acidimicrobiales bacterium]